MNDEETFEDFLLADEIEQEVIAEIESEEQADREEIIIDEKEETESDKPLFGKDITQKRRAELKNLVKEQIDPKKSSISMKKIRKITNQLHEIWFICGWLREENIGVIGFTKTDTYYDDFTLDFYDNPEGFQKMTAKVTKMTKKEQVQWFKKMEEVPTEEERIKLRNEFIERNLAFARWMVKEVPLLACLDMTYEDKISYAFEGLIEAAERFDYNSGCAFSTYAYIWVKQKVLRGNDIIRKQKFGTSYSDLRYMDRIQKAENFARWAGEIPTDQDLAELLGMPIDKIRSYRRLKQEIQTQQSTEQMQEDEDLEETIARADDGDAIRIINGEAYLDGTYVEPGELEDPAESISFKGNKKDYSDKNDKGQNEKKGKEKHGIRHIPNIPEDPIKKTEKSNLSKELERVLSTLTEREAAVIRMRYGLDGEPPKSLEETGFAFNVTRERIRQIEAKALRKLRYPSRSRTIRGYLDGIVSDFSEASPVIRLKRKSVTFDPPQDRIISTLKDDTNNVTLATEHLRYHDIQEDEQDEDLPSDFSSETSETSSTKKSRPGATKTKDDESPVAPIENNTKTDDGVISEQPEIPEEDETTFQNPDEGATEFDVYFEDLLTDDTEQEPASVTEVDRLDSAVEILRKKYEASKKREEALNERLATLQAKLEQILSDKEPIQAKIDQIIRVFESEDSDLILVELKQEEILKRMKAEAQAEMAEKEKQEQQVRADIEQTEQEQEENKQEQQEIKDEIDKFFEDK